MEYGVTEVFVKHDYFSSLRIKLVEKVNGKLFLYEDKGDKCKLIEEIQSDKKLYPIKSGFFLYDLPETFFYIYEEGDYSFFRYKYIKHIGSSRSSKSWSLEECAIRNCEEIDNLRITVWRDSRESLGNSVWKDFRKIFPMSGRKYKFPRNTVPIFLNNGSVIEPHGDDTTNAHGITQDKAWLNEPYKMSKETFDQIDMRSEQIWIDINPSGSHWSDDLDEHPRCKVIHSTFQNNPFCPMGQKLKILSYDPENPINIANGTADAYMWSVYGKGEKAEKPNRIFKWKKITLSEYQKLDFKTYKAVDWGKVDPWGILEGKYNDGRLFLHELNYDSEDIWMNPSKKKLSETELHQIKNSESEGLVTWLFKKLNIGINEDIVCDNNRPGKIIALRNAGWERAIAAQKLAGSVLDGIDLLQGIEVFYTDCSKNLEYEQENYSRQVDRHGEVLEEPEDKDNHLIDPARYLAIHLQKLGIIKKV
ncbi:hypothetical protein [uncultured Empedobacter sp.]|uniref:hypothetical protein n=1 Tax=uncultured Empedobacter sp. TaxID=410844 RepID=UPI0025E7C5E4|nr:hypothetical protein [uncultured Empedobacter sp.]